MLRTLGTAVASRNSSGPLLRGDADGQRPCLAAPDDENPLARQAKPRLDQLQACAADGRRHGPEVKLRLHLLGTTDRIPKDAVKRLPDRSRRLRRGIGLLHLSENLILA